MNSADLKILIVAEDGRKTATLAKDLVIELKADITIVDTVEEAVILTSASTYDAIIASAQLPDGSGLSLLPSTGDEGKPEGEIANPPVIILEDSLNAERVLSAIRNGAADVLVGPIEPGRFVESVRRVSKRYRRHRITANRTKRLRRLTSKLVGDRRELRKRVDVICRDLVQAYQKLAEKVVEIQETSTPDA